MKHFSVTGIILVAAVYCLATLSFARVVTEGGRRMFTIGYYYLAPGYDPSKILSVADYYMIHNLGGTLLQLGEHDQYYSCLAKRWDVDSDKKEMLITLREDARFSDGSRITAQDVVFTFKRLVIRGSNHLSLPKMSLISMRI